MKIIWSPATTLDGYIAKSDGNSDWVADKDSELFNALIKECGCVIVGHRTYEEYKGEVFPAEGATTFVWASESVESVKKPGVEFVSGASEQVIKQIEDKGFKKAVLAGGGKTNDAFLPFVNEITVTIYPMIFGNGIRLLSKERSLNLELLESKPIGNGIIRNHYRVK